MLHPMSTLRHPNNIQLDDLRYMWQGKPVRTLTTNDKALLEPIGIFTDRQQRAILLLHGFSSSPAVFREIIPHLNRYDAIVCPQLPGHGQSINAFATATANEWLMTVQHSCEQLCQQYQHVDVLGLSLGGLLACYLAQQFPIHHLYLLAPALALHLNIPFILPLAKGLHALGFRYLRNRSGDLYGKAHQEITYRQLPLHAVVEILTLIQTTITLPSQCPVDLFLGRYDAVVDSTAVANQFADLKNVTTHWLNESAHVLPLDNNLNSILACLNATSGAENAIMK